MKWDRIRLQPIYSGCPNRCRHCCDEGSPPFGDLMSLEDIQWIVAEFDRAWQDTFGTPAHFRILEDGFEPTVHQDFIRLRQYVMSFLPASRREEFDTLGTNGHGLARAPNWRSLFEELAAIGVRGLGFAVHGLEQEHDWFVQRDGAYQDITPSATRALDSGLNVSFEIHLNKRNLASFPAIVDALERLCSGRARIWCGVPGFYMNDRLRAFDSLRPTKADWGRLADTLERAPDRGSNTEAHWTRLLTEKGKFAGLCTYEPAGRGPEERALAWLRITPAFDVIEMFESRPPLPHGNLKRDGISRVWAGILEAVLPTMPEPEALAQSYGNFESEALHPGVDSVYMKLCDRYWQSRQV